MPVRPLLLSLAVIGAAPAPAASAAPPVVTLLGDSITAGYGLPAADALPAQLQAALGHAGVKATVRGAGVSGDTSADGLARVDFSVQPDTALCVVELGANDYLQSRSPAAMKADLTAIVRRLKARRIAVLLAGGTVPASTGGGYSREFNAVFPAVAREQGVPLAPDFLAGTQAAPGLRQADGLHPDAAGVRLIAARLAQAVAKALRRPR